MNDVVGVDIGGTNTEAVRLSAEGAILARVAVATETNGGSVVRSTLAAIAAASPEVPAAVGIGVPGQVDGNQGNVRLAVNLNLGDVPFPIGNEVSEAIGAPVTVENDVRAAALGVYETFRSTGEEIGSLVLLSIGTGISAGLIIDGEIHRGANGMAGEIGHVMVDANGPFCRCGLRGCLEAMASGPALARAWPHGTEGKVSTALFAAEENGDTDARRVVADLTRRLGSAIHWLAAAYDVERIFLGGGVASAGPVFLHAVRNALVDLARGSELAARTLSPERIALVPTGEPVGARGAAALARRHLDRLAAKATSPSIGGAMGGKI